ncbi:MAG: hypothetical protein EHM55_12450 [Acidobacteria bacterium]|nr:MAG: hypothetical protein EHM55_12450 [Acidobacteriota bacterium]
MMRLDDFRALNARLEKAGQLLFANPRKAAAGSIRQLDPRVTATRRLDVFFYDILHMDGGPRLTTDMGVLQALAGWKLHTPRYARPFSSFDDVCRYHQEMADRRESLGYEIDGATGGGASGHQSLDHRAIRHARVRRREAGRRRRARTRSCARIGRSGRTAASDERVTLFLSRRDDRPGVDLLSRPLEDDGRVDIVHGYSSHHPRPIEVYREQLIGTAVATSSTTTKGAKDDVVTKSEIAGNPSSDGEIPAAMSLGLRSSARRIGTQRLPGAAVRSVFQDVLPCRREPLTLTDQTIVDVLERPKRFGDFLLREGRVRPLISAGFDLVPDMTEVRKRVLRRPGVHGLEPAML